jgi:hypothetical protein
MSNMNKAELYEHCKKLKGENEILREELKNNVDFDPDVINKIIKHQEYTKLKEENETFKKENRTLKNENGEYKRANKNCGEMIERERGRVSQVLTAIECWKVENTKLKEQIEDLKIINQELKEDSFNEIVSQENTKLKEQNKILNGSLKILNDSLNKCFDVANIKRIKNT